MASTDLLGEALRRGKAAATAVVEFAREMAFELRTESHEAVRTGFGIPRAVTSVASLGCFAVAAAGTASLTADFAKKVYGVRECDGCSGWEALTCGACSGSGKTSPSGAQCTACRGTGVVDCSVCKGNAWKPKFTLDRLLDSPIPGWNAYRKCQPVVADHHQEAIHALVEHSVSALPVPPRPKDWSKNSLQAEWDERVRQELEAESKKWGRISKEESLQRARAVEDALLDSAWAVEWRDQQVQDIYKDMNAELAKVRKQAKPSRAAAETPAV